MPTHFLAWTDAAPACLTGGAVSIGNFDGVHRGHRKLLTALGTMARKVSGPAVAVTFDPPPVALLNPVAMKPPLTTIPQRAKLLHDAGADHVVVLKVEASLLALSAESFIEEVLQKQLGAKGIVEGSNFRFGHNREGDTSLLSRSNHFAFEAVPVDAISSSKVREALNAGNVAAARDLLGRAYSVTGTVIEGAKRGRTIGIPTANLGKVPTLIPATGVYAVTANVQSKTWCGAANVGPNPTFGDDARKLEVHLIGFDGDLYGQPLEVRFLERLRDVKPFPSVEALVTQVKQDLAAATRMRVQSVLQNEVAAALELDGSGLEVVAVENGIASVRIGSVCAGCPASISVIVQQIESELRERMPEIDMVEAVA